MRDPINEQPWCDRAENLGHESWSCTQSLAPFAWQSFHEDRGYVRRNCTEKLLIGYLIRGKNLLQDDLSQAQKSSPWAEPWDLLAPEAWAYRSGPHTWKQKSGHDRFLKLAVIEKNFKKKLEKANLHPKGVPRAARRQAASRVASFLSTVRLGNPFLLQRIEFCDEGRTNLYWKKKYEINFNAIKKYEQQK